MPRRRSFRIGLAVLSATLLAGCGGGGGSKSKVHALGDTAVVEYSQPTSTGKGGPRTTLAVTVLRVRKGTKNQLTQGGLEPDDKQATSYYVDTRFENRGQTAVKRSIDVSLEDSDGNSLPTTLIFGIGNQIYAPCPNTLKPGEGYKNCSLVLVPKGRDVKKVLFVSQKPGGEIVFNYWDAKL